MRLRISFVCALMFLFSVLPLMAQKINLANDMIGSWRVTTIRTVGGQSQIYKGTNRFWKLPNGTYRSTSSGRMGIYTIKQDKWMFKNGTMRGVSYVNGQLNEISNGTWKQVGNVMNFSEIFNSLGLSITTKGYYKRINRNKYVAESSAAPWSIKNSATFIRVGK